MLTQMGKKHFELAVDVGTTQKVRDTVSFQAEEKKKNGFNVYNECHTLSRFDCYLKKTPEIQHQIKSISAETVEANLFYKSVPCAFAIISQGEYYKISRIIIICIFILF